MEIRTPDHKMWGVKYVKVGTEEHIIKDYLW